jgi:hypothetical protein
MKVKNYSALQDSEPVGIITKQTLKMSRWTIAETHFQGEKFITKRDGRARSR